MINIIRQVNCAFAVSQNISITNFGGVFLSKNSKIEFWLKRK